MISSIIHRQSYIRDEIGERDQNRTERSYLSKEDNRVYIPTKNVRDAQPNYEKGQKADPGSSPFWMQLRQPGWQQAFTSGIEDQASLQSWNRQSTHQLSK